MNFTYVIYILLLILYEIKLFYNLSTIIFNPP